MEVVKYWNNCPRVAVNFLIAIQSSVEHFPKEPGLIWPCFGKSERSRSL